MGLMPLGGNRRGIAVPPVAWNPARVYEDAALFNGNLKLTWIKGNGGNVQANISRSTGKYYWEITIGHATSNPTIGVGQTNYALDDWIGQGTDSVSYAADGSVFYNTVAALTAESWSADGTILSFALDLDNKKFWVRKNNGNWNNAAIGSQNPATNTGGVNISTLTLLPWAPMSQVVASTDNNTANFGGTRYAYDAPAGFSSWSGVGIDVEATSSEYSQFLDRVPGMDATHNNAFTALINGLVADGLWTRLDALWIGATDTEAHSFINLKSSSFAITKSGSVTFTADQGWTGAGGFLDTNYPPSTAGGNLTLNSAAGGAYIRNNRTANEDSVIMGSHVSGDDWFHIEVNAYGNNTSCNINGPNSNIVTSATTAQGFHVVSRTTANALEYYRNGASVVQNGAAASSALSSMDVYLLSLNLNGSQSDISSDQLAAAFMSSSLDDTQVANLSSRINTYMTAVGANVY